MIHIMKLKEQYFDYIYLTIKKNNNKLIRFMEKKDYKKYSNYNDEFVYYKDLNIIYSTYSQIKGLTVTRDMYSKEEEIPTYKSLYIQPDENTQIKIVEKNGISLEEYLEYVDPFNPKFVDLDEYIKKNFEPNDSHIKTRGHGIAFVPDIDLSECQTVEELIEAITDYSQSINSYYDG